MISAPDKCAVIFVPSLPLSTVNIFPDFNGNVFYNDGFVGDKLSTLSIMGRDYFNRDGYIYHPDYKSFSCDAEAFYVAQMRGKHHYFDKIIFKHQHPAWIGIGNDETYSKNSLATDHDLKVYWHRLNNYFFEPHDENTPIPYKQFMTK